MVRYVAGVVIGAVLCTTPLRTVQGQERVMELSLEKTIDLALRENLNLKSYSLGLRIDEHSIEQAKGRFDPTVSLSVQRNESIQPNFYDYITVDSIDQQVTQANLSLGQSLTTGGDWGVGFYNTLSESNIEREKNFTSYFGLNVSQPLLRGFGRSVATSNIYLARLAREQTELDVQSRAIELIYNVTNAYWDLEYARETLRVREMALAQADSLLADNRTREQLGILTRSDVLEAESAMLQRRQEVLDQQNIIRDYEDNLRRLLNLTSEEDWRVRLIPTSSPEMPSPELNIERAYHNALANRPDYLANRKLLERGEFNLALAKNDMRPNLDLTANYRVNGSGATYSSDIENMTELDQYGWSVGLNFQYPIGNRDAESRYQKQELSIRQTELGIEDMESQIMREIRTAVRNVEFFSERLENARVAVEVNELKLRTEEERFRNQLSTSYYVLQYQNDLANARNQYNKTIIDYILAVTELQRVSGRLLGENRISIIGLDN